MSDVRVVRVDRNAVEWRVWFSHKVRLKPYQSAWADWGCTDRSVTDELGVYLWGLEVIRKHKEM